MADFTQNWGWPQWVMLTLILAKVMLHSEKHGKPMLQSSGDEKGQPDRHNGFSALIGATISIAVLICGGFFA